MGLFGVAGSWLTCPNEIAGVKTAYETLLDFATYRWVAFRVAYQHEISSCPKELNGHLVAARAAQ